MRNLALNILILTRTEWSESPRLRHQIANLLAASGHNVFFVQKPNCLFPPSFNRMSCDSACHRISLFQTTELLNHQLRFFPCLHRLNAFFARHALENCFMAIDWTVPDLIINFNYDAFWLRSLFPLHNIITIINDDFEAAGRFPVHSHLTWALKRTCMMSTRVLTVSEPLRQRLSQWCKPELFLPWSSTPYNPPSLTVKRNVLLYWGYINERLDFFAIKACLTEFERAGLRIRFVGPMDAYGRKFQSQLVSSSVVEWLPASPFNELDTSDCFAGLLPYRLDYTPNLAAQLPNKALQLLSRGLPLISTKLPRLHQAPFVIPYSADCSSSLMSACLTAQNRFFSMQPQIVDFVALNSPKVRLRQLLDGVS